MTPATFTHRRGSHNDSPHYGFEADECNFNGTVVRLVQCQPVNREGQREHLAEARTTAVAAVAEAQDKSTDYQWRCIFKLFLIIVIGIVIVIVIVMVGRHNIEQVAAVPCCPCRAIQGKGNERRVHRPGR